MRRPSLMAKALATIGISLVLAGCGGGETATDNSGAGPGSANDFAIGNDASAMEMVGSNLAVGADMVPMNMAAPGGGNEATANSAGPAPSDGNIVESNVAGM